MTFSDNGVDLYIAPLLRDFGHACEVGANDGVSRSNTMLLEENGWTVLCVEPNPNLAHIGRGARKLWRQVAAGPQDADDQRFWSCGGFPHASYSALYMESLGGLPYITGNCNETEFLVPVRRLDRILEEAGFPRCDLVCIDVEGYENEVLEGFDPARWSTEIMVIESIKDQLQTPDGFEKINRLQFDNVYRRIK